MYFPIAGFEANIALLFSVSFLFGLFMAQVGITGAILTLPFMISLGFVSLAVSATNLVGNLLAPLGGIFGFHKERRMLWALGVSLGIGGVLGAFIGPFIRINFLSEPGLFKIVLGILMMALALRLFYKNRTEVFAEDFPKIGKTEQGLLECRFEFGGRQYSFNPVLLAFLGLIISAVGTCLGVSGAFMLVPICLIFLDLPIYLLAGAALFYTFFSSIVGVLNYIYMVPAYGLQPVVPDWRLGLVLGAGLLAGGYVSARFIQKRIPSRILRMLLGLLLGIWGLSYVLGYFV